MIVLGADIGGKQRVVYRTTGISGTVDGKLCVAMAFIVLVIAQGLWQKCRRDINFRKQIIPVKLWMQGQEKTVYGLCDTGNGLVEPITGKPVCVLATNQVKEKEKPVYIPYNTIDRSHGIMKGFWLERMMVSDVEYENVPVAVCEKEDVFHRGYEMIIHPEYFEKGGEKNDSREKKRIKRTLTEL
jgi:hypothetical protein